MERWILILCHEQPELSDLHREWQKDGMELTKAPVLVVNRCYGSTEKTAAIPHHFKIWNSGSDCVMCFYVKILIAFCAAGMYNNFDRKRLLKKLENRNEKYRY